MFEYNYHSHTQFCDGRADMATMAAAAFDGGFKIWGISPHSPICVDSPCNMSYDSVPEYLAEANRLKELYDGRMSVLTGMEIDFISHDFGPHIDYFQNMPLDFRIGSVHFVPNQQGIPVDCDGAYERFAIHLRSDYNNDLRYVVEKYFEQVLTMIERGGFDILGHLDKIAGNATVADPELEEQGWYRALVDDTIRHALDAGLKIEINTKAYQKSSRFFPSQKFWYLLPPLSHLLINSDAHYPDRVNAGRREALQLLLAMQPNRPPVVEKS